MPETLEERITKLETLFCSEMKAMRDLFSIEMKAMRELSASEMKAIMDARDLQAIEYERRLKDLNGEYARIEDFQSKSLTKEYYTVEHSQVVDRLGKVEMTQARQEGKADQSSVNQSTIIAIIGIVLGISGVIISILH